MEKQPEIIKSNRKITRIPSSILDLNFFKKLYAHLLEINSEGAQHEINNYKRPEGQTDEDFEKSKKETKDLYKVIITISGSKGEFILSQSDSIFDDKKLPYQITNIQLNNAALFNFHYNINPQNMFTLNFYFKKPKIFDFSNRPSNATLNDSKVDISGQSETWVNGAYEKILSLIRERSTKRNWIHARNIYDIFLLFIFIPLIFLNLYRIEKSFANFFTELSPVLTVGVYVFLFFIFLWIFLVLFNYLRWLFPYIEFRSTLKRGSIVHRVFFGGIILSLAYTYIKDLLVKLFSIIFNYF